MEREKIHTVVPLRTNSERTMTFGTYRAIVLGAVGKEKAG